MLYAYCSKVSRIFSSSFLLSSISYCTFCVCCTHVRISCIYFLLVLALSFCEQLPKLSSFCLRNNALYDSLAYVSFRANNRVSERNEKQ